MLENALTHVVRIDEARHELTITDQTNTVTWHRWSFPRIRTSWSRGLLTQKQFRRAWRRDETTGKRELVEKESFDSDAGRDMISRAARAGGWTEKKGPEEQIGLVVGVGTLVLIALMGVGFGIFQLIQVLN